MRAAEPLTSAPLVQVARSLRQRQVSPVELVDAYTRRIEEAGALHAYITVPDERARREAQQAERRLASGEGGALLGGPIAVQDLFATRGLRPTAGSRILRDWVPKRDAAGVARLRAAGAIIFGKTNLHEFAYGVTTANPWWGVARNPHDPRRSPGGSSGGSAIAVVAGLCAGALGSDTGGSIRIPASLCGCVGLKPTFGAIPLGGTFPLGWSLDHAGPLTRTVDDAGVLLDVLSGGDAGHRSRRLRTRGLRVGVLRGPIVQDVQPSVSRQGDAAAAALRRRGLRALVGGADYVLAQRMRDRIRVAMGRVFDAVDVVLLPTTPIIAPVVGERT